MLLSLLYLYLQTPPPAGELAGSGAMHSFAWVDLVQVQLSNEAAVWVMMGFFLAFAVKMPVFPLHTWQPDTYVTSPTGGTMLLAGIMLKMGTYGIFRFIINCDTHTKYENMSLCVCVCVCLYAMRVYTFLT